MKKKMKLILLTFLVFVSILLFTSISKAVEVEGTTIKGILPEEFVEVRILNGDIDFIFDGANMSTILNNLTDIKTDNEGYVYEGLILEVPNTTTEVRVKEGEKTKILEIKKKGNKKYIEYDIRFFKKDEISAENSFISLVYNTGFFTIECYDDEENIEVFYISKILEQPVTPVLEIVDKNGDSISTRGLGEVMTGESSVIYYTGTNYNEYYYQITSEEKIGEAIEVKGIGIFELCNSVNLNYESRYVYRCKITDGKKFYKRDENNKYVCTFTLDSTGKTYMSILSLPILGDDIKLESITTNNDGENLLIPFLSNSTLMQIIIILLVIIVIMLIVIMIIICSKKRIIR